MNLYAFCRSAPLSHTALRAQIRHARRLDKSSKERQRPGAKLGASLHWCREDRLGMDTEAQLEALLESRDAKLRKGSPVCLHTIAGVSGGWVNEVGVVHDAKNYRNIDLVGAAVDWANGWSGGGVLNARLDLDEYGSAVVDLFVAPIELLAHKHTGPRPWVSVNACLERLSMQHCKRKGSHYEAMNTDWHAYAVQQLDQRFLRGDPAKVTGRQHVHPDVLRRAMQAEKEALAAILEELKAGTLRRENGRLRAANPDAFARSMAWAELRGTVAGLIDQAAKMRILEKKEQALLRVEEDLGVRL